MLGASSIRTVVFSEKELVPLAPTARASAGAKPCLVGFGSFPGQAGQGEGGSDGVGFTDLIGRGGEDEGDISEVCPSHRLCSKTYGNQGQKSPDYQRDD
jgi:hypothetical protein